MQKLLITGTSGFLGWNICRYIQNNLNLQSDWLLVGTYLKHAIEIENCTQIQIDITDDLALKELFESQKPDAVIHAAASSKPNYCQEHPKEAYKINVEASVQLAKLCKNANIPMIFTSTDLVFDGTQAPYKETDPTSAISAYGKQKVEAEQSILEHYPEALICRMPLMFGDAPAHANLFFSFVIKSLRASDELKLFNDDVRVPISGQVAAEGLLHMLGKTSGILHMGGDEQVTRFEFGQKIVENFGIEDAQLTPISMDDVDFAAPPSKDVAMDCGLARALGFHPPTLESQLTSLKYLINS